MRYWLFKSEAATWSWEQQVAKGEVGEEWDGVRNYQARNNMREMALGDRGFFYLSQGVSFWYFVLVVPFSYALHEGPLVYYITTPPAGGRTYKLGNVHSYIRTYIRFTIYEIESYEISTCHYFFPMSTFHFFQKKTSNVELSMKNHPICSYFQLSMTLGGGVKS